jgi:hypothetical protein
MADDPLTLANLLVINDRNNAERAISDLLNDAPFIARMAADIALGTTHQYTKEIEAPLVGFRAVNAGRAFSKSTDELVTADLKFLDAATRTDKAWIDAPGKYSAEEKLAREISRHLRAGFYAFEHQVLNGTIDADGDGFVGFANVLDHNDDAMVVDALGTTDKTASSVYMVRSDVMTGACLIVGKNGQIEVDETVVIDALTADDPAKHFAAYYTPIGGWLGLQVGGNFSVGRICNLTEDSGKGLTDDLLFALLAKFPAARQPNLITMNRRSLEQLRKSRTATNATGAPAPIPTDVAGIPIIPTAAIASTEALLTESGT